ncbi:YoaK family protein [Kitasatospora sp. NPDC057512]|uniref:YoaK family protein n=1 Tax=Kitasatospora sp. NPDC057512 TaxID=3346154 RepID=UPI003684799E
MRALLTDALRTLAPPRTDRHGPLPPLMLLLTVATGVVDAVSYLGLGHVFVANMTGNVVLLGFALAGASGLSATASLVSLAAFLTGALAGYALIVLLGLGLGMGLQNAVARRIAVPDLTTTVLTLTLTGLASDSPPAGGTAPRPGRRILSALAMLLGGLAGAVLVLHGRTATALALAALLLLGTALAAHRLSAASGPDAPWATPTA